MIRHHAATAAVCISILSPGIAAAAPACGSVIGGEGETVFLDGNVGPCPGTALFVASGTALVNLGGFTVSCDPDSPTIPKIGIDAYETSGPVVIINGTVTGCEVGVSGRDDSKAAALTLDSNDIGFIGGFCENSSATNNETFGMQLQGGESVACTATGNGQDGFLLNGEKVEMRESTASGNGWSGVHILGSAKLEDVEATGNGLAGFLIGSTDGAVRLDHVTASNNTGSGFAVVASGKRTVISDSLAESNGVDGFDVGQRATLRRNTSAENTRYGIRVAAESERARVRGNTAQGNLVYDLFDESSCVDTRWRSNVFSSSNDPCIK